MKALVNNNFNNKIISDIHWAAICMLDKIVSTIKPKSSMSEGG
ncbi:MAG: hypothetical protein ABI172_13650 [Ginsengibacter sp.]